MLATLSEPFDQEGWQYEIKWDGYRAVATMRGGEFGLWSRNRKSFDQKYYPIYEAIQAWGIEAVVDGEIVALNKEGKHDFNTLQNWTGPADGELLYYVFDLLWLDGHDVTGLPLEQRRTLLQERLPDEGKGVIRFSENFNNTASELLEAVEKMGMEGIIAKKTGSFYYPGLRTADWLKMKTRRRQEVVIGGYMKLHDSPKPFSSLLIGVYEEGKFRYVGKVGTGFSIAQQKKMLRTFERHIRSDNPFEIIPTLTRPTHFRRHPTGMDVTFMNPELVCEVFFTEITAEGLFRHPAFAGMRTDKAAEDVQQEMPVPASDITERAFLNQNHMAAKTSAQDSLITDSEKNAVRTIVGKELKFTNLDKYYWPDDKITKRNLINYYHQVAPYMMPYLKNRPMSLHRHPNGYKRPGFYQKDVTGKVPDWVETLAYRSEEEADVEKEFLVCTDEAALLYMANLGCIEINPWNSTTKHPEHPDWCALDLDPDKKNTFEQVIQVANVAHDILRAADIPCYCKTSGSTGLHIYIPLQTRYTYDQSVDFARLIASLVQRELPDLTSLERSPDKRKGLIYLDYLQNRTQATLAAPYSVRPKAKATVSMPLDWNEVKKGLHITDFTIRNTLDILKERGDLFTGVLKDGIDMAAALDRLESAS